MKVSRHLSDLLNTTITFQNVADELFLYEMGSVGDHILQAHIKKIIEDAIADGANVKNTEPRYWIDKKLNKET